MHPTSLPNDRAQVVQSLPSIDGCRLQVSPCSISCKKPTTVCKEEQSDGNVENAQRSLRATLLPSPDTPSELSLRVTQPTACRRWQNRKTALLMGLAKLERLGQPERRRCEGSPPAGVALRSGGRRTTIVFTSVIHMYKARRSERKG